MNQKNKDLKPCDFASYAFPYISPFFCCSFDSSRIVSCDKKNRLSGSWGEETVGCSPIRKEGFAYDVSFSPSFQPSFFTL
jgi:hypothetical protein